GAGELLSGKRGGRLRELTVAFAAEALVGLTSAEPGEAIARAQGAIDDGSALRAFASMVRAQGGDPRVAEDPWAVLPTAPVRAPLESARGGFLATVDAEEVGRAAVDLGAGRRRMGDAIDPAVGIVFEPKVGDRLEPGQPIGAVHARDENSARAAAQRVLAA